MNQIELSGKVAQRGLDAQRTGSSADANKSKTLEELNLEVDPTSFGPNRETEVLA
jgi:hypothetical protein